MKILRILCGPTASGKSSVALHLAHMLSAELLSIDSMKLYSGLDIGTAKPTPAVRSNVRHHLINIKEPWESCSAAEYLQMADAVLADCTTRSVPLIGEGGTALYLKALCEGLFEGPGRDLELRSNLEAEAALMGVASLHARLASIDPAAAKKILPSDLRRIVRALEVYKLTGTPISQLQSQWGTPRSDLDVRLACLCLPRQILYARIDRRIDRMLESGWLAECQHLMALPRPLSREASQALGYRTLFSHLRGEMPLAAARERICFDTHHFARRQLGWFKRLPKIQFVSVAEGDPVEELAERVLQAWA